MIHLYKRFPKDSLAYIIILLFINILDAQSPLAYKVDSLNSIIKESDDTIKVNAYYQLGRQYVLNDSFAKALSILEKGAIYSKSINFDIGTGKIYEYIGIANDINGELDPALAAYEQSRVYHLKVPNNDRSLNLLDINIGVAYYFAGNLGKSLEYYLKAYNEAKRIGADNHVAKLVNNIAIIYRRFEEYDEALKYYKESVRIKQKRNDRNGVATTYQNIGMLFSYMNKIDSSILYLDKSKKIMLEINAPQKDIDYLDYARAEGFYNINKFDEALSLMSAFEKTNFSTLSESVRLNGKIVLADLYAKKGNHQRSIKILSQVEEEAGSDDYQRELRQVHSFRASSYMAVNDFKKASLDFQKAATLRDSINSDERLKLESEMQTKYSTLQKEQEIEKLTFEKEIDRLRLSQQKWTIGGLGLGLALLSFLLSNLFKQKKKIEIQNLAISKSASEKDILLREIHHRVKNNLQVVSSLLGIQGRGIKDQKAKDAIQEGRNRVQSMSLIHQNLYKKDNLTGIEMAPYIDKLSNHLLDTYQIEAGEIKIETQVEDITLDVETVVPIGLIINELISNSLKYAFPEDANGVISIHLHESENQLQLSVSDNGIGLSENQLKTKTETFGHSLIRAFKTKLDADISIKSERGTLIELKIKNYKKIKE